MSTHVTRRNFMKAAGTAAGVMVATRFNPLSYAANEKVMLGSIGTGGQGTFHLTHGLRNAKNLQVVAVCDVYSQSRANAAKEVGEGCKQYSEYKEMLEKEQLDGVIIATPFFAHYQMVMDSLDAGKYVFCEKTMCQTIDQCRDVVNKCNEKGLFVQVGHQRRYNPKYNKSMWLSIDKNLLGRINHITAQWHRNNDWRRAVPGAAQLTEEDKKYIPDPEKHFNWRLYHELSGGLMTELATHQLDVANWFLGSAPSRVSGFGGIDYWRDGRNVDDNVVLIYEWDINPRKQGFKSIDARTSYQKQTQLDRPYTVRMTYSSICANAKRGASEQIHGDRGTIELTEVNVKFFPEGAWMAEQAAKQDAAAKAKEQQAGGETKETGTTIADSVSGKSLTLSNAAITDGVDLKVYTNAEQTSTEYDMWWPNTIQFENFANDIITKGTPKANQMVGLHAAISGLKGIEALANNATVEISPELYAFDFETPDPWRYDDVPGPMPGQEEPKKEEPVKS